jgi:squalene-hopene/tetraprenyl-beta-curcumene cyclase
MRIAFVLLLNLVAVSALRADDEPGPKSAGDNRPDEPRIAAFSLDKGVEFLDRAALDWTRKRECFSCHTNFAFLYSRPAVSAKSPAHDEVRAALEKLVDVRWKEKKPRWDAEVVTSAAALAHNDAATTGKLHPTTKTALDRMWTVQRKDGGWNWINCDWPPMENDDHYGVTLAALAVGVAPEDYAKTESARQGVVKIREFLKTHSPKNAHHKAMLLWSASYLPELLAPGERETWVKEIREMQRPDGGWSAAGLYPWKRGDDKQQTPDVSDGYGTGLAILALRRAGVAVDDPALERGRTWLRSNQRESGRWFTRSLFRDSKHYLTHVGTAFAIMALAEPTKMP